MKLSAFRLTRHIALREWLLLLLSMLALAAGLGHLNGLGRLDQTLYDKFVQANTRPARDDIIIVAIDDYSLAQLGRWPWSRTLHAALINRINQARPRVIGLDLILSEAEPASTGVQSGDLALATALGQSRHTVLPIVLESAGSGLQARLPVPALAAAAHSLAHINMELDPDGVVRSAFLREGQNGVWWPHFALALSDPDGQAGNNNVLQRKIPGARPDRSALPSPASWQRDYQIHIPFSGGSGHFTSIPYVSVLRGEVPAQFFTGKHVLIGATAIGMADAYPTPLSSGSGIMSGVEIHANILASLLNGESIAIAKPWQTTVFSMLPVCIALLAFLLCSPRVSLLVTAALFVLTLAASYLALRAGLWIAPAAALIALLAAYPLWSWRRLEAAITYLGQEFIRLDREPHLLPESAPEPTNGRIADLLAQRIHAMENAARRVRDLRQFISDSLDSLPDATLVTAADGHVLLSNKHALAYFGSIGFKSINDALLPYLFGRLISPQPLDQAANAQFNWWDLLDLQKVAAHPHGIEVRDEHERDLLVKSAPCHSGADILTGWIVSIIDISAIRSAERSRDETLRFLSHDMRGPQASILALLELQQDPLSALPQQEFFSRLEKSSRKTLDLADNFVQLARAESQQYRLEELDFQEVLYDASDEMWTLAHGKQIEIMTQVDDEEYPVRIDRALMSRVLSNLLSNAIKYSHPGTRISCTLRNQAAIVQPTIVCSISDQGVGIAHADQLKLFRRFQRFSVARQPHQDGIGLGLVFVKTVIERHHGQIGFTSKVGAGSTFTIELPRSNH